MLIFKSEKNSGCYGNLKLPLTYIGKVEMAIAAVFNIFFTEMFNEKSSTFLRLLSKSLNLIG